MNDIAENEIPMTEPVLVPCLYVTGVAVENDDAMIRLVGWVKLPSLGGETQERRIVVRFAVSNRMGRVLANNLKKSIAKDSN